MPENVKIESINELGWGKAKTAAAASGIVISVCLLAWGILIAKGYTSFSIKGHEIILFPIKLKEHIWLSSRVAISLGTFGVGMGLIVGGVVAFNRWELKKSAQNISSDQCFHKVGTKVYELKRDAKGNIIEARNISDDPMAIEKVKKRELEEKANAARKAKLEAEAQQVAALQQLKENIKLAYELVIQGPEKLRELQAQLDETEDLVNFATQTVRMTAAILNQKGEGEAPTQEEIAQDKEANEYLSQTIAKRDQIHQELQDTCEKIAVAKAELRLGQEHHPRIAQKVQTELASAAKNSVMTARTACISAIVLKERAEQQVAFAHMQVVSALTDLQRAKSRQRQLEIEEEDIRQKIEQTEQQISQEIQNKHLLDEAARLIQEKLKIEREKANGYNDLKAYAMEEKHHKKAEALSKEYEDIDASIGLLELQLSQTQQRAVELRQQLEKILVERENIPSLLQQRNEEVIQKKEKWTQATERVIETEKALELAQIALRKTEAVDPETIVKTEAMRLRKIFAQAEERVANTRQMLDVMLQEKMDASTKAQQSFLRLQQSEAEQSEAQTVLTTVQAKVQHLTARLKVPMPTEKQKRTALKRLQTAKETLDNNPDNDGQKVTVQRLKEKYGKLLLTREQTTTLLNETMQKAKQAEELFIQKAKLAAAAKKEWEELQNLSLKKTQQIEEAQKNADQAVLAVLQAKEADRTYREEFSNYF